MANKHLKLGTRVKLSPLSPWVDKKEESEDQDDFEIRTYDPSNPAHVKGTVIFSEVPSWVTVLWDNGHKNHYRNEDSDLIPVE